MALSSMIKPEMHSRNVKNIGCLNIIDKLLHYVSVHILSLRANNFSQLFHEDIFMLWIMKNNILIN